MLQAKELREQPVQELQKKCEELARDIYKMNSELKTARKIEKPHELREKKRDRARILTVLSQKSE
jgi:large subunit ribosomal protein L29